MSPKNGNRVCADFRSKLLGVDVDHPSDDATEDTQCISELCKQYAFNISITRRHIHIHTYIHSHTNKQTNNRTELLYDGEIIRFERL